MNAISFHHVGKMYRLGTIGTGTLSHDLNRWWQTAVLRREDPYLKIGQTNDRTTRSDSRYVWALQDIDFQVEQGEVVGIIGKNGAGKSTLLKLLSNITSPTMGSIEYEGRIASLLEVGTGFHPEMTGRENIYMNGAIMGMTRQEITRKLDEIVDFAGCARYIDTPVKRYSSGMTVRLGFAIAAFLEPEILVVDEVLAVGDAEFQKKAIGKMQDVSKGEGRTVLFVSHNMAAVRNLCTRGIVLQNGKMVYDGNTDAAIRYYLKSSAFMGGNTILDKITFCLPYIHIDDIQFNGTNRTETTILSGQKTVKLFLSGDTTEELHCEIKLIIRNQSGTPMATFSDGRNKGSLLHFAPGHFEIVKEILLPRYLSCGDYNADVYLHVPQLGWLMQAPEAIRLHIDGSSEEFGQVMKLEWEGFCGLESR